MKIRTVILSSEVEFRNYVISNSQNISQVIIFEDILDCVSFFYCFCKDGTIVATKEFMCKSFSFFRKTYNDVAAHTNLSVSNYPDQKYTILLVPEESKQIH